MGTNPCTYVLILAETLSLSFLRDLLFFEHEKINAQMPNVHLFGNKKLSSSTLRGGERTFERDLQMHQFYYLFWLRLFDEHNVD